MRIFSNTAVTLDGRISMARGTWVPIGTEEDTRVMSRLRDQADAVLVGGNSYRCSTEAYVARPEDQEGPPRATPTWNVVVSRGLKLPLLPEVLEDPRIRPLFFTSASTETPEGWPAEVARPPEGDPTPRWMVAELERRGVQTLLVEAGGDLIYQFLRDDLLDEMFLTVTPRLLGLRGAPALADGSAPLGDPFRSLSLVESRVVGDEVFLHYRRA